MTRIQAKVAQLLTEHLVAVTAGSLQDVSQGDTVILYEVVTVKDPDTSEPLGEVKVETGRLTVKEVHEGFSVASVPFERSAITDVMQGGPRKRLFALTEEELHSGRHGLVLAAPGQVVDIELQR